MVRGVHNLVLNTALKRIQSSADSSMQMCEKVEKDKLAFISKVESITLICNDL